VSEVGQPYQPPAGAAWEYHLETIQLPFKKGFFKNTADWSTFQARFNELGLDGWELVRYGPIPIFDQNGQMQGQDNVAIFKRPRPE
jgi:hypothetical protein